MIYPYVYFTPADKPKSPESTTSLKDSDELLTKEWLEKKKQEVKVKLEELGKLDLTDTSSTQQERELVATLQELEYDLKMLELTRAKRKAGGNIESDEVIKLQSQLLATLRQEVEAGKSTAGENEEYRRAKSVAAATEGFSFTGDESADVRELFWFKVQDGEVTNYSEVADNVRTFQKWWNANYPDEKITVDGIIGGTETLPKVRKFLAANAERGDNPITTSEALRDFAYAMPKEGSGGIRVFDDMRKQMWEILNGENASVRMDELIREYSGAIPEGYKNARGHEEDGTLTVVAKNDNGESIIWNPETQDWQEWDSLKAPTEEQQEWTMLNGLDFDNWVDEDGWVQAGDGYFYKKGDDGKTFQRAEDTDGTRVEGVEQTRDETGAWVASSEYTPSVVENDREKELAAHEGEWPSIWKDGKFKAVRVWDKMYAIPTDAEFTYNPESGKFELADTTDVLSEI